MNTDFVEAPAGRQRRRYSAEFRAEAIEACKVSVRPSHLERGSELADDGVHQSNRWTPCNSTQTHGVDLKARVLSECERPGASVAAIAMAHGLNANLVHKWRRKIRFAGQNTAASELAPFIALPLTTAPAPRDIRIELCRAALTVNITWPVDAADKCAALLHELLR